MIDSREEFLKQQYLKAYDEGRVPEDIPRRPDLVYEEWTNWADFLGAEEND